VVLAGRTEVIELKKIDKNVLTLLRASEPSTTGNFLNDQE